MREILWKSDSVGLAKGWSKVVAPTTMIRPLKREIDGLMKSVVVCGKCSEKLVKELCVNIPKECDIIISKVYKRILTEVNVWKLQ